MQSMPPTRAATGSSHTDQHKHEPTHTQATQATQATPRHSCVPPHTHKPIKRYYSTAPSVCALNERRRVQWPLRALLQQAPLDTTCLGA
jgi:hypothetical protein